LQLSTISAHTMRTAMVRVGET
jgi:hypothetical protein